MSLKEVSASVTVPFWNSDPEIVQHNIAFNYEL